MTALRPDPDRVPASPTGQQWTIGHGEQQAVITEVGATLRAYSVGGRTVVDGFEADEWAHDGRGQVLAPWPNRLRDGRFQFAGSEARVPLDEPERGNAIHGLVRWLPWAIKASAQNTVTLGCVLRPTPAYPFVLQLHVRYRVGRDGLDVSTHAVNRGPGALPFGLGFHPYLTVGTPLVDTAVLRLPAAERLVLDDRGLPTGQISDVTGTELDFRSPRTIGPTRLDTAYTRLSRGDDGRAWATIEDPFSGQVTSLWVDERFGYLMCYTGDNVDDGGRRRRSLAVEPMTCPPDGLRTGQGLVVLQPGEEFEACWGIRPS